MAGVIASIGALRVVRGAPRLGPYRLAGLVVESGFARIHRATDTRDGRAVALKVFHPAGRNGRGSGYTLDQWRRRFLAEARLLAEFRHPNVIEALALGDEDGERPWFAMPWMVANLRREIGRDARTPAAIARLPAHERPRAVTVARALTVLRQLASGLAALHARGLVHRDVKPTNLLVTAREGGDVRLCDLGMVKLPATDISRAGVWVGTPDYMAPEQYEDASQAGDRADVYSAGVLGYRLLTGVLPAGAFRAAHDLVPGVPPRLGELLQAAMAPEPGDRPSAAEMEARLAELQSSWDECHQQC
ncbi:MAG: serine/threonine-protein kinase [Pseudomonadota bacterium]